MRKIDREDKVEALIKIFKDVDALLFSESGHLVQTFNEEEDLVSTDGFSIPLEKAKDVKTRDSITFEFEGVKFNAYTLTVKSLTKEDEVLFQ